MSNFTTKHALGFPLSHRNWDFQKEHQKLAVLKFPPGSLPPLMRVTAGATTVFLGVENAAETTAAVLSIAAGVGVPGGSVSHEREKHTY